MVSVAQSQQQILTKTVPLAKKKNKYKWDIAWANILILVSLHLMGIYGFTLKYSVSWATCIFWKSYMLFAFFGVTAGAHRLWAHRTYKANNIAQIILMIMFSTTYQNSIYVWARDHRLHHKHSDTDADPHNAKSGLFFSHVGWLLVRKHPDVILKGRTLDMRDLEANPIVMFQHRYYTSIMIFFTFIVPTFIPWYFLGESLKNAFFVCTVYRYIFSVNTTWCINSLAHKYGNKPYDKFIVPVDNSLTKILTYGEGFHNYHHTFPWDYRTSETSTDGRNMTTYLIDSFAAIGWVTDRKVVTQEMIQKRRQRSGDCICEFPECSIGCNVKEKFVSHYFKIRNYFIQNRSKCLKQKNVYNSASAKRIKL